MNCPYSVGWFPLIKLAKKLKEEKEKVIQKR
jgi:hypothetical protein